MTPLKMRDLTFEELQRGRVHCWTASCDVAKKYRHAKSNRVVFDRIVFFNEGKIIGGKKIQTPTRRLRAKKLQVTCKACKAAQVEAALLNDLDMSPRRILRVAGADARLVVQSMFSKHRIVQGSS